tara:strand:+ start:382 stop:624 length:243 start_codon:yes stop_codon:yes gene_type:complete
MSKYEEFQEWLNQCPTQIENYQDNGDHAIIRFDMPLDDEAEEVEQCVIDTNGDYAKCVDRMVETMNDSTPPEVFIPNFHD